MIMKYYKLTLSLDEFASLTLREEGTTKTRSKQLACPRRKKIALNSLLSSYPNNRVTIMGASSFHPA